MKKGYLFSFALLFIVAGSARSMESSNNKIIVLGQSKKSRKATDRFLIEDKNKRREELVPKKFESRPYDTFIEEAEKNKESVQRGFSLNQFRKQQAEDRREELVPKKFGTSIFYKKVEEHWGSRSLIKRQTKERKRELSGLKKEDIEEAVDKEDSTVEEAVAKKALLYKQQLLFDKASEVTVGLALYYSFLKLHLPEKAQEIIETLKNNALPDKEKEELSEDSLNTRSLLFDFAWENTKNNDPHEMIKKAHMQRVKNRYTIDGTTPKLRETQELMQEEEKKQELLRAKLAKLKDEQKALERQIVGSENLNEKHQEQKDQLDGSLEALKIGNQYLELVQSRLQNTSEQTILDTQEYIKQTNAKLIELNEQLSNEQDQEKRFELNNQILSTEKTVSSLEEKLEELQSSKKRIAKRITSGDQPLPSDRFPFSLFKSE